MLPPLQHFVPPTAVWRRPVSLAACRNKHFLLEYNSKCRELFHYRLVCKRKLLTACELPCHNSMRNGRGEGSKGSYIPPKKHYHGFSQADSAAKLSAASSPPAHRASASQHVWLPSDAWGTSGSWGASNTRASCHTGVQIEFVFSVPSLPLTATPYWPPIRVWPD